jgi:hypothetical protein
MHPVLVSALTKPEAGAVWCIMLYFWCSNVVVNRSHLDLPFLLHYQSSQIYCQHRQMKVSHSFHHQRQAEILTRHLWSSHHLNSQMSRSRLLQTRGMKVGFVLLVVLFDFWVPYTDLGVQSKCTARVILQFFSWGSAALYRIDRYETNQGQPT